MSINLNENSSDSSSKEDELIMDSPIQTVWSRVKNYMDTVNEYIFKCEI